MTEQIVEIEVRIPRRLPIVWHEHSEGRRIGDLRGRRSSVLLMIIPRGATAIVWVSCFGARTYGRKVYTEVELVDVEICAACTALELLKLIGDEIAEVN